METTAVDKLTKKQLEEENNDLMLMTNIGKIIRMTITGISVISRNTQGVKLMGLEAGERVVGAARLAEAEESDEEEMIEPGDL